MHNHFILDIKLNRKINLEETSKILEEITDLLNLTSLKKNSYLFENGGFTTFFLLAESHISAHYRIEDDYLALDIYSCRSIKDYEQWIFEILKKIDVKSIKITKLFRDNKISE